MIKLTRMMLAGLLAISAVAHAAQNPDRNANGQNSDKSPKHEPTVMGTSNGNPAPRTGSLDHSTNMPGAFSGDRSTYPQSQRIHDGDANRKPVGEPPVRSSSQTKSNSGSGNSGTGGGTKATPAR